MSYRLFCMTLALSTVLIAPAVATAQRVYHAGVTHVVLDRGESSFDNFSFFTAPGNDTVLGRNDLDFDWEMGNRVNFGWGDGATYEIDAEFTIFDDWENRVELDLPEVFNLDAADPGSSLNFHTTIGKAADIEDAADSGGLEQLLSAGPHSPLVEVMYRSEYKDAEVKMMRLGRRNSFWRAGFGPRFVDLDESLLLSLFGQFSDTDGDGALSMASLTAAGFAGLGQLDDPNSVRLDFDSRTSNQLYGMQVLFTCFVMDTRRFSLDVRGKAGAFYNDAEGQVVERIREIDAVTSANYARTWNDDNDEVSFAANSRVNFAFKARSNVHLKLGLEANFLGNVATAVDQLRAINPDQDAFSVTSFEMRMEDIFMYGANGGIEVWW